MTRSEIFVRFRRVGFHRWPGASGKRAYLAFPHRHVFHVEVSMDVGHDEREVEFHDLLDAAQEEFGGEDRGTMSCEAMARELGKKLARRFGRAVVVCVSEDGEAGSRVRCDAPSP